MQKNSYFTKTLFKVLLFTVVLVFSATLLYAVGTSATSSSRQSTKNLYREAKKLTDQKNFEKALPILEKLNKREERNPEVLNLLAYAQRNVGEIDESIKNYQLALSIKPKFPEAREYLGEAYLYAALRELKTLEGYGKEGEEAHEELKEVFLKLAEQVKE